MPPQSMYFYIECFLHNIAFIIEYCKWYRKMLGDRGADQGCKAFPVQSMEIFSTCFSARWRSNSRSILLHKRSCTNGFRLKFIVMENSWVIAEWFWIKEMSTSHWQISEFSILYLLQYKKGHSLRTDVCWQKKKSIRLCASGPAEQLSISVLAEQLSVIEVGVKKLHVV